MAYSIYNGVGDGVTTQYPINFTLGFLKRADVTCRVGSEVDGFGQPVYRTLTWINDGLVQINGGAPGNGVPFIIARTVDKTQLIHDYSNGEPITEENLDESNKQTLMAVHEILDGRLAPLQQDLNMSGHKIINLAAGTAGTDAVNKTQLDATTALATGQAALAELWATKLTTTVDGVNYSSKQYALNAAASAVLTAADRVQTGLDRVATAADVIAADLSRQQAEAAAAGMKYRAVRAASTANVASLSGPVTIDGVSLIAGDRVLLKNQSTSSQNGIYQINAGAWTRATDADTWSEIVSSIVTVEEGTVNADLVYLCTSNSGGTLGSTAIVYILWSAYVADGSILNAKLGNMSANTLKGNATNGSAVPTDIALAANKFLARSSTGDIAAKDITDVAFTLLDDTTVGAMRTTLGAAGTSQVDWFAYCPGIQENGTQYLILTPGYGMTLTGISYYCGSGSITALVVNDSVGNIASLSVSTTPGATSSLTNATIGPSGALYIAFSSASSCKLLNITFRFTRTLA